MSATRPELEVRALGKDNTGAPVPRAYLYRDGLPLAIGATDVITFHMIADVTDAVKIAAGTASVINPGGAGVPAEIAKGAWQAAEVDTAGVFWGWFRRTPVGGNPEDFPIGPLYKLVIWDRKSPVP
jgi:hypothetical protein